jgi:hypothetical protein
LRDYDTISDLRHKVEDMPEELGDLYSHMLLSMPASHRAQSSKYLQLVLLSSRTHGQFPMTPLQLSFADEQDYGGLLCNVVKDLSGDEESWRLESIEGRLRSRCCGLIEVRHCEDAEKWQSSSSVDFLHRTVVEFLSDEVNWQEIKSWAQNTGFDAAKALMVSTLAEMRAKLVAIRSDEAASHISMARLLATSKRVDTASQSWCEQTLLPMANKILFDAWDEKTNGRCRQLPMNFQEKLLVTAAYHCSEHQLLPLLVACQDPGLHHVSRSRVAAYLLSEYFFEASIPTRGVMARGIAACRADPNEKVSLPPHRNQHWYSSLKYAVDHDHKSGWSLWEFALHHAQIALTASDQFSISFADSLFDILIVLLRAGADRTSSIRVADKARRRVPGAHHVEHHADDIVRQLCYRSWRSYSTTRSAECGGVKQRQPLVESLKTLASKLVILEDLFTSSSEVTTPAGPSTCRVQKKTFPDCDRHASTVRAEHSSEQVTSANIEGTPSWPDTPWKEFLSREEELEKVAVAREMAKSVTTSRPSTQQTWTTTPRSGRLRLLNPDDQAIALELSQPNSTPQIKRQALAGMMRRTRVQQERILECVEALKKSEVARPADNSDAAL